MVAQAHDSGRVQSLELLGSTLFPQRSNVSVNQVAGDEHKVGMFVIDHVYPSAYLAATVMESCMHVAQHDNFQWSFKMFLGLEVDFLP